MPSEIVLAELVTPYKKGNAENPANYRPIALLDTLYKIYASQIQRRLCLGLDQRLCDAQFGFRKNRSTSQLLFVTRRLQDQAEQTCDKLSLVVLDWGKAFDEVDQDKFVKAWARLGVRSKMVDLIESF